MASESEQYPYDSGEATLAGQHGSQLEHTRSLERPVSSTREYRNNVARDNARVHYGDQNHHYYARPENVPETRKDPLQRLLESLSFPQKNYRFTTIEPAYRETCQWLFETPEYTRWRNRDLRGVHNRILWLKGKPGTGKSTITKCALEHANTMYPDERNIYFFFNARGDKLEKCTEGMFRSLLHQIAQDVPSLLQSVDTEAVEGYDRTGWPIDLLRSLFRQAVLFLASNVQLNCYIDALDEGEDEDQTRVIVGLFEELAETAVSNNTHLSIYFASRHYPNITVRRSEKLVLDDYKGHHADIASYVWNTLWCQPPTLKAELVASIIQRSAGIFLWVVLVVRNLDTESARGNQHKLRDSLQATPKGLDELFGNIVGDLDSEGLLLPILLWTLFARRSLSPLDLYLAVIYSQTPDTPSSVIWDHAAVDRTSIQNFITSSSRGLLQLVTITDDDTDGAWHARFQDQKQEENMIVQFIHESVRNYLLETGLLHLDLTLTDNLVGISNLRLAQWCRSYVELSLQHVVGSQFPKEPYLLAHHLRLVAPFSRYALAEILHYSEEAASRGLQVPIPFEDCLGTHLPLFKMRKSSLFSSPESRQTTLHVLAQEGHTNLILKLLERYHPTARQNYINLEVEGGDENQCVALHLAAEHRRLDVVHVLLENGADVNARDVNYKTALHYAARSGHTEIVRALLSFGADVNATDVQKQGALHYCARDGYTEAFEDLVRHGADVNACNASLRTPLMFAVIWTQHEMVKTLLAHGPDINAVDENGFTPLHHAYLLSIVSGIAIPAILLQHGADSNIRSYNLEPLLTTVVRNFYDAEHVQLLLRYGADVNAGDKNGKTALHTAVEHRDIEIIDRLLQQNADVNARDKSGNTPLALAVSQVRSASPEVVRVLLENGANVNAVISGNFTVLRAAFECGNVEVIKMLLVYGADVHSRVEGTKSIMDIAWERANPDILQLLTYFADVPLRARFEAAHMLECQKW